MRARTVAAAAAAALTSTVAATAGAQVAAGFDVDRFDPSERGSEWFSQDSLDLRGHLRPAAGIVGDFAYRPLVFYNPDGSVAASLVRNQFFLHAGGTLVLWDRLRVGLNLPVAIFEDHGPSAGSLTVGGVTYKGPSGAHIGDLRLTADVRLYGEHAKLFTLAFGGELFFPTGSQSAYTGDGDVRFAPRFLAAGRAGPIAYAARFGFMVRPNTESFDQNQLGSELLFGAAAGVELWDDHILLGPELFGSTVLTGAQAASLRNTPFELLFGGHLTFAHDWRAGLGIGPGLSHGYGSPEVRTLVSIEWAPAWNAPAPPDRDHDGVPDDEDACPDVPGVKTADPKTNGCPEVKPADRDGDGILDAEDACPDVPGVRTADPKTNGCPPDRDHDGVLDAEDACPDVPGIKTSDPKTNGCPDRDGDGVPDMVDACPDVPGVKTDDPKTNGCPADRDKDGILDAADACPENPGPPNSDPAKNGCPLAVVQRGQIRIMEQIKFRSGSAEIDPASDNVLDAVRAVLQEHTEIHRLRVEGHTDNVGSLEFNLKLSKTRAKSVLVWLVQHGIDGKRLDSQGYGFMRPIADNTTEAGRHDNRRVEFHIVDGAALPYEQEK